VIGSAGVSPAIKPDDGSRPQGRNRASPALLLYTNDVTGNDRSEIANAKVRAARLVLLLGMAIALGAFFLLPAFGGFSTAFCLISVLGFSLIIIGAVLYRKYSPTAELFPALRPENRQQKSLAEKTGPWILGLGVLMYCAPILNPGIPAPAGNWIFVIGGIVAAIGAVMHAKNYPFLWPPH
jgi:hypothetical protein